MNEVSYRGDGIWVRIVLQQKVDDQNMSLLCSLMEGCITQLQNTQDLVYKKGTGNYFVWALSKVLWFAYIDVWLELMKEEPDASWWNTTRLWFFIGRLSCLGCSAYLKRYKASN